MIQIQNITVNNFKNIESADLDLNPINVIIGPNGSGKTNFLMVLAFLKVILKGSNDDAVSLLVNSYDARLGFTLPNRGKDNVDCFISLALLDTDNGETINYLINLSKVKGPYEKELPGNVKITREQLTFKQKSATGAAITVFSREDGKVKFHNKIRKVIPNVELDGYISAIKPLELYLNNLDTSFKSAITTLTTVLDTQNLYLSPSLLKFPYQEDRANFDNRIVDFDLRKSIADLNKTNKWHYFIETLKNIVGLSDIYVTTLKDRSINKEFYDIEFVLFGEENGLTELSDGMILIISLVLKIISSQNNIIILEEPENSIHPNALNGLISFIRSCSETNQFIISTHSTTLLNLISPNEVLVSSIQKNGLSTITHISNEKELRRKLSKGFASFGDLIFQVETEFEDIF